MSAETTVGPAVSSPTDDAVGDGADFGFSVEHRLRRATGSAPRPEAPRGAPAYRRRVVLDMAILAVAALAFFALVPFADAPNPEFPEARDAAIRIDAAWQSISGGGDAEEIAAAADLRIHAFVVGGRPRTIITHLQPTAAGTCYALRFGPGVVTAAGVIVDSTDGCTPVPPGTLERVGAWSDVLPSQGITPRWYVPVVALLVAVGLFAVTDAIFMLLTKPR